MAETIDQQFIEYIVKALVGHPDKVKIDRSIDERGVLLELYVEPEDLGRVIGRNGATAKSIRTLLRALGVKNDARYNLKIVDTGPAPGGPVREDRREEPTAEEATEQAGEELAEAPETSDTADSTDTDSDDQTDDQVVDQAEEPAEPEAEPEKPEEDTGLARHREEIEDITKSGLDI